MGDKNLERENFERAWEYYKHSDNLQHQRHSIFLLAQSIFFAAYATAFNQEMLPFIVLSLGFFSSILWICLSNRLYSGLKALEKKYLRKSKQVEGDEVYTNYLEAVDSCKLPNAHIILDIVFPNATILAWIILFLFKIKA